jgi:hypothetical protein
MERENKHLDEIFDKFKSETSRDDVFDALIATKCRLSEV